MSQPLRIEITITARPEDDWHALGSSSVNFVVASYDDIPKIGHDIDGLVSATVHAAQEKAEIAAQEAAQSDLPTPATS